MLRLCATVTGRDVPGDDFLDRARIAELHRGLIAERAQVRIGELASGGTAAAAAVSVASEDAAAFTERREFVILFNGRSRYRAGRSPRPVQSARSQKA
jgi:hypothetical protein